MATFWVLHSGLIPLGQFYFPKILLGTVLLKIINFPFQFQIVLPSKRCDKNVKNVTETSQIKFKNENNTMIDYNRLARLLKVNLKL